jgi:hypothetical protein
VRLIRLFFEPYRVLRELPKASWVPALVACAALSLLTNLILVNAIGADVIVKRIPVKVMSRAGASATFAGLYIATTFTMLVGCVTISVVMWMVLRILYGSYTAGSGTTYTIMLTVCAYAAFARECARFMIAIAAVSWHHFSRTPLRSAQDLRTSLAAFMLTGSRQQFILAKSMDVLMLWFLVVVAVGLSKAIPNLRLHRAVTVVLFSWLIYIGLALAWGW